MLRRVAMSRNWPGYRDWVSTPCNSLSTAIPNSQGETDETTPPDFMQWAVEAEGILFGCFERDRELMENERGRRAGSGTGGMEIDPDLRAEVAAQRMGAERIPAGKPLDRGSRAPGRGAGGDRADAAGGRTEARAEGREDSERSSGRDGGSAQCPP